MPWLSFFSSANEVGVFPPSSLDWRLVALSVLIVIAASIFALYIVSIARESEDARVKEFASVSGALAFGLGVWAMHFIGMMALRLCVSVSYDPLITAISVVPAFIAAYAAIKLLLNEEISRLKFLLSGSLFGIGVGTMHYVGMQAMIMSTSLRFELPWFVLSVIVAIGLGTAALWLSYSNASIELSKRQRLINSGVLLGLAIAGMHYVGMKSAVFIGAPTSDVPIAPDGSQELTLAITFAVIAALLCVGGVNFFIRFREMLHASNATKAELLAAVRKLEQNEQLLEARVRHRTRELEVATKAAQEASESKSNFLATMSHEIRTPMNGVLGMTELLLESGLNPEQRGYARNIAYSGQALLAIINDILDLSKIEAGYMEYDSHVFSVQALVESVITVLSIRAHDKGIGFHSDFQSDPTVNYVGDSLRIRQILFNLVSNAVKFTKQGEVRLIVSKTSDGLRFEVRDTGIGIPKESMEKLFSSFFQVDSTTSRKFGGTGLGLVICKKLAEGMHGTIGVESELGKGSCFWFELPLPESSRKLLPSLIVTDETIRAEQYAVSFSDTVPMVSPEFETTSPKSAPESSEMNILLVEDHPINQKLATVLLDRLGFKVDLAKDGAEGVKAAEIKPYALILMDVQMPVMNGFDATRAIRAGSGPNAKTPIIALTANAMQSDKDMCLEAGMNDFLTKPFNREGLVECIQRQLEKSI